METWYRDLFENAPAALVVADYSAACRELTCLPAEEVADFSLLLWKNPEVVSRLCAGITFVDMNRAARALFGMESIQQLRDHFYRTGGFSSWGAILSALVAGEPIHDLDVAVATKDGGLKRVSLGIATVPGEGEHRVIFSLAPTAGVAGPESWDSYRRSERRYRTFFDAAPWSMWEEDFTDLRAALKDLRAQGVTDFRAYFEEHPEFVVAAIGMIRILDINDATVVMYGAADKAELLSQFDRIFLPETLVTLRELLIFIANDRRYFVAETVNRKLTGELVQIIIRVAIPAEMAQYGNLLVSIVDITEQRQTEEALRESSKRYQDLADLLPQTIFEADLQGRLTYVNEAGFTIFGYEEADFIRGVNVIETLIPAHRERGMETLIRVMRGDVTAGTGNEYRMRKRDGTVFPALIYSAPLVSFGSVRGVRGILVDITPLKRAEEQVLLRDRAIASAINAIAMTDLTGCLTFVNTAFLTMWGYRSDSEVLGKPLTTFFDGSGNLPSAIDALQVERFWIGEMVGVKQGGGRFDVQLATSIACDDEGKTLCLMISAIDITEKKQAEQDLLGSERKFRAIVETTNEWIWASDPQAIQTYSNPAIYDILGYTPEEIIGKPIAPLLHPDDVIVVSAIEEAARLEKSGWSGLVLRWRHKDGSYRYLESTAIPLFSDDGSFLGFQGADRDITERRLVEEALEASELRYRQLVEALPDAIVIHVGGQYAFVNRAALEIFGATSPAELIGTSVLDRVLPESRAVVRERIAQVASSHVTTPLYQQKLLRLDGTAFDAEIVATSVVYMGVPATQSVVRDITERKRAEEALRRSEEKFSTVFRMTPILVALTRLDTGQFIEINDSYVRHIGYQREELVGRTALELNIWHDPEDRARLVNTLRSHGHVRDLEVNVRHRDGQVRLYSFSAEIMNLDGKECMISIAHDITESKRAESALKESEARYRRLSENAPDIITRMALPSGRYEYVSPAAIEVTGYTPEEYYGTPRLIEKILHPEWLEYFREEWRKLLDGIAPSFYEYQIVSKSGETKWINQRVTLLRDEEGRPVAIEGIASDVTLSKTTQEVLRRARQASDEANRAKTEFLANMSHEIRTPLTSIIGFTELLEQTQDPELQKKYLEMIRSSGEILKGTVNDILDLAKIEAGKLELETIPFSLREVVQQSTAVYALIADQKGVRLTTHVDRGIPATLYGDPEGLRKLLANLVSNAVKFTREGEISVTVTAEPTDGSQAVSRPRLRLHIKVHDTGIGIAPEKQAEIFGSFIQGDGSISRKYGGTGLGTTIARKLAELMGGTIRLASTPAVGSLFHVTVELDTTPPVATPSDRQPRLTTEQVATLREKPVLRILVAEDNTFTSRLMADAFSGYGHEVVVAADGRQAVATWLRGDFDLVLMDVQMPEMSGLAAAAEIRRLERSRGGRVPIVAMTANVLKEDRDACFAAGMDEYFSKPVTAATVLQKTCGRISNVTERPDAGGIPPEGAGTGAPLAAVFRQDDLPAVFRQDPGRLEEYGRLFLVDLAGMLQQLCHCVETGDALGLGRATHSLKGLVAQLQDSRVQVLVSRLEQQQAKGELPVVVKETINLLQKEYDRLAAVLSGA